MNTWKAYLSDATACMFDVDDAASNNSSSSTGADTSASDTTDCTGSKAIHAIETIAFNGTSG